MAARGRVALGLIRFGGTDFTTNFRFRGHAMTCSKFIAASARGFNRSLLICGVLLAASFASAADPAVRSDGAVLHFLARTRTDVSPKSGRFEVVERPVEWDATQTALIICDLWDRHWCDGATQRVGEMA